MLGGRKIVAGRRRRQPDVVVRIQHYWCIDFCRLWKVFLVLTISFFPENLLELVDIFSILVNKAVYLHFYVRKISPKVVSKTVYPNKWVDSNLNDLTYRIWTNSIMGHLAHKEQTLKKYLGWLLPIRIWEMKHLLSSLLIWGMRVWNFPIHQSLQFIPSTNFFLSFTPTSSTSSPNARLV